VDEASIRKLIDEHFATAGKDEAAASAIYSEDAVLEFPQGRERIRGRQNIHAFRSAYPAALEFEVARTLGSGHLWVNEYVIRYDGKPSYAIGVMEFRGDKVTRETIYVTDGWDPPEWRAQWVESMDDRPSP
jgi:ketosteroid isomerase-like protein